MKVQIDELNRIHLVDDQSPKQAIIFDLHSDYVAIYQDSDNPEVRTAFEKIDEATQFNIDELITNLKEVIELLESKAWLNTTMEGFK